MRNLKRALSLTLASVMLLGMMVVGTSALSFNDAEDITNVTAASVLEELKVMQGDGKGNFMPEQSVTRAQMAIIICRILYGDKLNVSQFEGVTSFNDVPVSEYYTGYINLASSLGIINGYGDGRFGPDDTVTTAQAALMLCRALGWFQAGEMTGDWGSDALTAIAKATDLKMFGSLKLSTNALLARDNVAEMVFNTITKTNPVQYSERWDNYYTDEGGVVNGVKFSYLNSLGYKNFTLVYSETEDDFGRPTTEWGIGNGQLDRTNIDDHGDLTGTVTIKTSYIKASDTADATYTAEVKASEIYKDLSLTKSVAVTPTVDGQPGNGITLSRSNDDDKLGGNGILVEAFKEDDETVKITVINTYLAQATEDYNSKDEEVDVEIFDNDVTSATLELEDFAVSNVKEDDYLLVTLTKKANGSLDAIQTVASAESLSEVTVSASRKNDYVTADSQRYKYNATAKGDADTGALGYDFIAANTAYDLNDGTYNLYLDSYGYVIGVEEAKGDANVGDYLIVVKDGVGSDYDARVRVMFTDGTEKTITVSKVDGSKASDAANINTFASAIKAGTFYTYKEKSGEYELTVVQTSRGGSKAYSPTNGSGTPSAATTAIESKVNPLTALSSLHGNSKTLFIADGKTFTGVKNAPEVNSSSVYYVLDKDGDLLIVWTGEKGKNASNDLVYILDAKADVSGDNDVYTYKAIVNGKEEEIKTENADKAVGLYEVDSYDSDGVADLETNPVTHSSYNADHTYEHAEEVSTLKKHDNGYVNVDGTVYELADSYQIISVDGTTVDVNVGLNSLESLFKKGFVNAIVVREKDDVDAKAVTVYVIKPAGRVMADEVTDKLEETGKYTLTETLTEDVTVEDEQVLTLGTGAEIKDGKTVTVKTGATVKVRDDVTGGGEVKLDGGKLEVEAGVTKLPNIDPESTGTITVANGGKVQLQREDEEDDEFGLNALAELVETLETGTGNTSGKVTTYTYDMSAADLTFAGKGYLESYSGTLTLETLISYFPGAKNVGFVDIKLPNLSAGNTVKVAYTLSSGTVKNTIKDSGIFGTAQDGKTLTEALNNEDVVLPYGDNVTTITITVTER